MRIVQAIRASRTSVASLLWFYRRSAPPAVGLITGVSHQSAPPPLSVTAAQAVEMYQSWIHRWRIAERFPQPVWSIVDLWIARKLLSQRMPPQQVQDLLRLASPYFPRADSDPDDYLRRTVAHAAVSFPASATKWLNARAQRSTQPCVRRVVCDRPTRPYGFSMWLAGGGIKGGMIHGATDEYGYYAIQNKVTVHDRFVGVGRQLVFELVNETSSTRHHREFGECASGSVRVMTVPSQVAEAAAT